MLLANSIVNPGMTLSDGDFKKTGKSSEVEPTSSSVINKESGASTWIVTLCRKRPDSWHFTSVRPSEPCAKGPIYPACPATSLSPLPVAVLGLKSIIFLNTYFVSVQSEDPCSVRGSKHLCNPSWQSALRTSVSSLCKRKIMRRTSSWS